MYGSRLQRLELRQLFGDPFPQGEWSRKHTGFDSYCVYAIGFAIHYRHVFMVLAYALTTIT
jgi:hypothetical protein